MVKELLDHPRTGHLVVGVVDVSWSKTNHDKQQTYPVVRFRHIEAVSDKNLARVAKVLGDELAKRTGQTELPFPPGEEIPLDFGADDEWGQEVEGGTVPGEADEQGRELPGGDQ
jgi:hypothetical protein